MKSKSALDWLLEEDQPSVRYLALTQLLERPLDDPEVVAARAMIPRKGWAAEILANQDLEGWWVRGESLYRPRYLSANWMLLILADLGLTRADPRIRRRAISGLNDSCGRMEDLRWKVPRKATCARLGTPRAPWCNSVTRTILPSAARSNGW